MAEPGLYALTKVIIGGLSAVMTGPMGTTDIHEVDLRQKLNGLQSSYAAEIYSADGTDLGWAGHDRPGSPRITDLPEMFIYALLSVEDARYGLHPGVDPIAVAQAGIDTLQGAPRGGSTLTQQLIKNAVTGPEVTLDRKIREAIIAVRAQAAFTPREILQAYLANAWFGRGQQGAAGAALAWFGKTWDDIEIHEAAFLAGILKGPGYYDPILYPERAKARRDIVIAMMQERDMINVIDMTIAQSLPLKVITEDASRALFNQVPHWISVGIAADLKHYDLMSRSDISSGKLQITTTIQPDWQMLAQEALLAGINRLSTAGPAVHLDLPDIEFGSDLTGLEFDQLRQRAANALATTRKSGRALVTEISGTQANIIIDRGYGPLEWDQILIRVEDLGYTPARGDVLSYKRLEGEVILQSTPQVQGAVIVMDPTSGAILASVGGSDPDLYPFDRTGAQRQPGSALKPFLWARAMEGGLHYDDLVPDVEQTYKQSNGIIWRPKNYDHSQSGLIPLFVALEQSSNLVAAHLIDQFGVNALATITELAGVYEWNGMRRHRSSALGASETSIIRMAAGYAAIANGGFVVTPHRIKEISHAGQVLWTPPDLERSYAIATRATTDDITSMLYGVTRRGTAYSAFKDLDLDVAGKTGTTEGYRDAWFMSFTPGVVVAVWIGKDDFTPIPGKPSGSRAAAPIARAIYKAALEGGLLLANGYQPDQEKSRPWPPRLLTARAGAVNISQEDATQNVAATRGPLTFGQNSTSKQDENQSKRPKKKRRFFSIAKSEKRSKKRPEKRPVKRPVKRLKKQLVKRSEKSDLIFKSPW